MSIAALTAVQPQARTQEIQFARQDSDSIAGQLSADDPRAVAWAAYLASENRLNQLTPQLIDALASPRLQQPEVEWVAARLAVLDALIQLGAKPPVDLLDRYYSQHREQVLILLAAAGAERDSLLVRLLRTESGICWHAAAGLLLETRPQGFASGLIAGLQLRIEIKVVDGPPQRDYDGGIGGSGYVGHHGSYPAPGFPSIATYSLWGSAQDGAVVLSDGPHPVYYTRRTTRPDWITTGAISRSIPGPDANDRLKYLEALLEVQLPVRVVEQVTLNWTTPARFRADVNMYRDDVASRFQQVRELLHSAGLLTADEGRTVAPRIDVVLKDLRWDTSVYLWGLLQ